ncbi:MAG: hypothetical protein ACFFAS_09465 [Promethearchaeota archaeon]
MSRQKELDYKQDQAIELHIDSIYKQRNGKFGRVSLSEIRKLSA